MVKEVVKVKRLSKVNMFYKGMISKMWLVLFLLVSFLFYDYSSRVSRVNEAKDEIESSVVYMVGSPAVKLFNSGFKWTKNKVNNYWNKEESLGPIDAGTNKSDEAVLGTAVMPSENLEPVGNKAYISPPVNVNKNPADITYGK